MGVSAPAGIITARVLIAGASYAGLAAAVNLLDLHEGVSPRMAVEAYRLKGDWPKVRFEITIVDERDGFFHVVGAPLALANQSYADKAWVEFGDLPDLQRPNITFIHGTVTNVDWNSKRATVNAHGEDASSVLGYDYFVAGTGLRRVWPVVPQSFTRKGYLTEVRDHIQLAKDASHGVLVVGGGAVGIEMAAELKLYMPDIKVMLAHSRDKLLSSEGLSDECKDASLRLLKEAGVEVSMGHRLDRYEQIETSDGSEKYQVRFTNGTTTYASLVIMAVSKSIPSTSYLPASALDSEGYVKIQPNLMIQSDSPNADRHYCAGDAAKWSGIKRCGGAMNGGYRIANNIHQSILKDSISHSPEYKELVELEPMIALAVGESAVSSGPHGTDSGAHVMQKYFGDDLYLSGCWRWLGLGIGVE
ncbi:pyridine nucleotide-disulfide oxidoreductase, NAD-binding domain-containing protein [Pochonia chlamydosporia 170]|uniref:Pyridine nucleotide-disulfide oxidoreductase, NAD-binding domain-containing protein n=1 Tax=Pochonia chlamydosporia 170 TaxID=1380566 RepID=A0A179F5T2_METCM|nr:pyridine nucleotide-disulfide oxidoreductase, NAD-binding domain-containing protein [Pochonia chlamydosporia 170]OAQ60784.2 pyridine nucleotide-disulfide oxidoreductase, NAD-binding domain-containing protein [Pochonia chlamydosporia 170]